MQHCATRTRLAGLAVTAGMAVAAAAGLGPAPAANATCASVFGIGNSTNCTSSFTSIAIAIGDNAAAHADHILGAAYALGKNATAETASGQVFNMAVAFGESANAQSGGIVSTAVSIGRNTRTISGVSVLTEIANLAIDLGDRNPGGAVISSGSLNLALDAFGGSNVAANGIGNVAVNAFGADNFVNAYGRFNNATNFLGNKNFVNGLVPVGGSTLTSAFVNFGANNVVQVGKGPVIIAGSIFQNSANVAKLNTGININGLKIGGAASRGPVVPAAATAAPLIKPAAALRNAPRAAATTRTRGPGAGA